LSVDPDPRTSEFDERRRHRGDAAVGREGAAELREAAAAERDGAQAAADEGTRRRRGAADRRGHDAADLDEHASERASSLAAEDQRTAHRGKNAQDRADAAADREAAIDDRAGEDRDYVSRRDDLRRAQLDQLTGAFGRAIGLLLLEREIDRARRGNGHLVLVYLDVDGLKEVNDGHGHGAGDALLRDVVVAVQKHLRSYDTLVRVGGDEFVCALGDCTRAVADNRFAQIRATMRASQPHGSVSVGFAELRPGDTVTELIERGDAALYEAKRGRPSGSI
jgi:diguanylate cyclase (GGDEF)-like protein